jgi:hypothetical protein
VATTPGRCCYHSPGGDLVFAVQMFSLDRTGEFIQEMSSGRFNVHYFVKASILISIRRIRKAAERGDHPSPKSASGTLTPNRIPAWMIADRLSMVLSSRARAFSLISHCGLKFTAFFQRVFSTH